MINLKRINERLNRLKNGGAQNAFLRLQEDSTTDLRILPAADGDPFREFWFHYGIGKERGFLCPKRNFGEDCPICEFASELYRSGDPENIKTAKNFFARQRFFSAVVVRGQEGEGVKLWGYGKTSYETLLKLVLNPEYGDITDLEEGTDLTIVYSKPSGGKKYPDTSITPKRKTSSLCGALGEGRCKELMESVPDYDEVFERKSPEEVQAALDLALNAGASDPEAEAESSEEEKYGKEEPKGSSVDEAFAELEKSEVSGSASE
jgi:hypothetical protein